MPVFIPDPEVIRSKLGRPWKMWFTTAWWESWTLILRNGQWSFIETPGDDDIAGAERVFQQRNNYVTYQEVRDLNLTDYGQVIYVDDYDDMFSGEFISKENMAFTPAAYPEPLHSDTGVVP